MKETAVGLEKEVFYEQIYRFFAPDRTRDEFERDWREFQEAKAMNEEPKESPHEQNDDDPLRG